MRRSRSAPEAAVGRTWLRRLSVVGSAAVMLALLPASAALAAGGTTTGADVQVAGSASTGSPAPGAVYTYTFQVKNAGPDVAAAVVFNDPLPAGTVYNYATANGSTVPCAAFGSLSGGATVRCNIGDIGKGAQANIVIAVNAPTTASTYANVGSAASTAVDPNTANNSAAVTVQVKTATGGGGGGVNSGGVNSGGVNDTGTLVATPCVALGNLSSPTGYYLSWAAVWNTFTLRSCSANTESVNVEVTETNTATGSVDYDVIWPATLLSSQNSSVVLDNDFAPFSTTYNVTFTATDVATGAVLATGSVLATTPPPQ